MFRCSAEATRTNADSPRPKEARQHGEDTPRENGSGSYGGIEDENRTVLISDSEPSNNIAYSVMDKGKKQREMILTQAAANEVKLDENTEKERPAKEGGGGGGSGKAVEEGESLEKPRGAEEKVGTMERAGGEREGEEEEEEEERAPIPPPRRKRKKKLQKNPSLEEIEVYTFCMCTYTISVQHPLYEYTMSLYSSPLLCIVSQVHTYMYVYDDHTPL